MPKPNQREWFAFAAAEPGSDAKIYIYDYIGKSWWNDRAMDASKLVKKLEELDGQHVEIHINSLGGDAFEGVTIHNTLKRHKGGTTAYIDGIAYSAATHVALGCDKVIIAANALFGIHESWSWCIGNQRDMARASTQLKKVDHAQVVTYAVKTGIDEAEILKTMQEDVPFTAQEAFDLGYADQIGDDVEIEAMARSPLDVAAHRIPEKFAAMIAGFSTPAASIEDEDLKSKIELARSYAADIVDTLDGVLEDDETDAAEESVEPPATPAEEKPRDTSATVDPEKVAQTLRARFEEE